MMVARQWNFVPKFLAEKQAYKPELILGYKDPAGIDTSKDKMSTGQ